GFKAETCAIGQDLHQRAYVTQAEIEALPRDGVDAVCRIAGQREAMRDDLRGMVETERERGAGSIEFRLAEYAVHALLDLGKECPIGKREDARRVFFGDRPYQRA